MKNSARAQMVWGPRLVRAFALQAGCFLLLAGLIALVGCSSKNASAKPAVGAITFVDANGKPITSLTSLTTGQNVYVEVTLTNDNEMLGADWTVACGSKLPPGTPLPPGQVQDASCGIFTPTHTMSGPIPSYATGAAGYVASFTAPASPPGSGMITLYAAATADHSQYSSASLIVQGQPISVGFSPALPASVPVNGTAALTAILGNDYTSAGVNWTLSCGGSSCGSLSKTQTTTGIATTYTAPAVSPAGNATIPAGQVVVTATSVADITKSASATITIAPVTVSVSPVTFSVATNGTASLSAVVSDDVANRGVDWSVSCANTTAPGTCGSITAHTASGATATYTAPSLAQISVGTSVTVTATSTTDPTRSATATLTTIRGLLVTGSAEAMQRPVRGATVSLYAVSSGSSSLDTAAGDAAAASVVTDDNGGFSIPYGYECPTPDTQMYLISSGGNAGGGENPNLVLIAALGSCSSLDASRLEVNEATTIAAVYALSGFMANNLRIHASGAVSAALSTAFSTARDLVDPSTGTVRTRTLQDNGAVPQARINTLANVLSPCEATAGSTAGDGSACDRLFRGVSPTAPLQVQPKSTAQAIWQLVRSTTGCPTASQTPNALFQLGSSSTVFAPALSLPPTDWTLPIEYENAPKTESLSAAAELSVDSAGNVWVQGGSGEKTTEFVGAAPCANALRKAIASAGEAK